MRPHGAILRDDMNLLLHPLDAYSLEAAAQPGIAADRFAREIVGFLTASPSALAAPECQTVGRASHERDVRKSHVGSATHAAAVGRVRHGVHAGVLTRMPRPSVGSRIRPMPGVLPRMPRRSVGCGARRLPRVLARMPRRSISSNARRVCRGYWRACQGYWRACLGGRSIRSWCACLGNWHTCRGGRSVQTHGACLGCGRACLGAGQWEGIGPPAPPNTAYQLTAARARSCLF